GRSGRRSKVSQSRSFLSSLSRIRWHYRGAQKRGGARRWSGGPQLRVGLLHVCRRMLLGDCGAFPPLPLSFSLQSWRKAPRTLVGARGRRFHDSLSRTVSLGPSLSVRL